MLGQGLTDRLKKKMKYPQLLQQLYQVNMFNSVKLGLQNIKLIYEALDKPISNIPIVHVAGTNGKVLNK